MTTTVVQKLKLLSDEQLIQLSEELRSPVIGDDALIREVIRDSDLDTTAPVLAFVGLGQLLGFELADRLELANRVLKKLTK